VAFEIAKTKERRLKKQRQKRNTHSLPLYGEINNPITPTVSLMPSPRATRRITKSTAVLTVRPCTEKLDEENSKHAGLAQENGFVPAHISTVC
jgi:hypothetical protein